MMMNDSRECVVTDKLFVSLYGIAIVGLVVAVVADLLNKGVSGGVVSLMLVFGLLGSLVMFKGISLLRCPSRVLVGGILFIALSVYLDTQIF